MSGTGYVFAQRSFVMSWVSRITITHYVCFPHKEPRCGMTCSHREGSVQLLLFLAASYPLYVSLVPARTTSVLCLVFLAGIALEF